MRIGIITQPLHSNYGGILQNYALQTVLKRMGHEPITLREKHPTLFYPKWSIWVKHTIKITVKKILGRKCSFIELPFIVQKKRAGLEHFIQVYIKTTPAYKKYYPSIIDEQKLDAIIVGSDQVWRPRYNKCIEDSFLRFARKSEILKLAYAASFGTDNWEFSEEQTRACSDLIKLFCAVSVREKSGVDLCKQHFKVDAKWVLDPTLLLGKNDYSILCAAIPASPHKYILAYILDMTEEKQKSITDFASRRFLSVKYIQAERNTVKTDTVEAWLAAFRDAEFVLTDSFHGTVFAIIFDKPFFVFPITERGNTRINSLFNLLNIQNFGGIKIPETFVNVDLNLLQNKKEESIAFIRKNLN